MAKVVEEAWALNSGDTTAIPAANRADGAATGSFSAIWKYQVPVGQAHILKPGHHFSAYGYELSTAECTSGGCRFKIVIRDQSEGDEKTIYGPALYVASTDFTDVTKMAKLDLRNELHVEERFFIVILAYTSTAVFDESASYFRLETVRIRSTI